MRNIKDILMERDGMTEEEAEELIEEAKEELNDLIEQRELIEAENICEMYFGLEPDYLEELY